MRQILLISLVPLLFFGCGVLQPPPEKILAPNQEELKAAVIEHSKTMQQAFQEGNAEVYIPYVDPELVKVVGGQEALKEKVFAEPLEILKSLESVEHGEVSEVLVEEGQYVAIFSIIMTYDLPDMRKVQKSYRVGVSPDEGKSWHFLDGNGERNSNKFVKNRFRVIETHLKIPECYTRKDPEN